MRKAFVLLLILISPALFAGVRVNFVTGGIISFSASGTVSFKCEVEDTSLVDGDVTATMTSDVLPSPNVSTGTTFTGTYAYTAFDHDYTTSSYWRGNATSSVWLQFDFGAGISHPIKKIRYFASDYGDPAINAGVKDYIIKGSNDGSLFSDLATGTFAATSSAQIATFSNTVEYRYIRFFIENSIAGTVNPRVVELELWEKN